VDADGNRVNVGNFDRNGLNVNANDPSNDWNDNIGLLLSRNSHERPMPLLPSLEGVTVFVFACRIHPPIIFPHVISFDWTVKYSSFVIHLVSFATRKSSLAVSITALERSRDADFSVGAECAARTTLSSASMSKSSQRCPRV
jgi:hypothetical protein